MTLGQRQALFTKLLAQLLARMLVMGFEPRIKEILRGKVTALVYGYTPSQCDLLVSMVGAKFPDLAAAIHQIRNTNGSTRSIHLEALAADIDLFKNGVYLTTTENHQEFGEWWESLHPLCVWGGRFGDGNHYGITPDGVRK